MLLSALAAGLAIRSIENGLLTEISTWDFERRTHETAWNALLYCFSRFARTFRMRFLGSEAAETRFPQSQTISVAIPEGAEASQSSIEATGCGFDTKD